MAMFARQIGLKLGGILGRRIAGGLGRAGVQAGGRFGARAGRFAMTGRGQLAITGGVIGGQALYGAGRRSGGGGMMPQYGGGGGAMGPGGIDAPIVYTWDTGTAKFARLANGKIAVQKKDGTTKVYRPYRPVVIPKKWNARSMRRVATALKGQRKTADAIVRLTGGHVYANAMRSEKAIREAIHFDK